MLYGDWGPQGMVWQCPGPGSWRVSMQGVARPSFTRAVIPVPVESSLSSTFGLYERAAGQTLHVCMPVQVTPRPSSAGAGN